MESTQPVLGMQELSPEQKMADLDFLCSSLEEKHKNIYAKVSKEAFAEEREKTTGKIPQLSNSEFFYELKHLVALVGDAHTIIEIQSSKYDYLQALPFAVDKLAGNWYLFLAEKEKERYLGFQVKAINKMPIEEVYERAKGIISFENEAWLENNFSNTINFSDALRYLGVTEDLSSVTLTLQNPNGGPEELVVMNAMPGQKIFDADSIAYKAPVTPTMPQSIYRAFALDSKHYFIQYNSCTEDSNFPMKDFIKQVKANLSDNSYANVMVDLRYNTGGNSSIFEPMIRVLKRLQSKQGFQVYTLIGRNTFSSAVINSMQLQQHTDCTFVGTPTGGNVNGFGELQFFELPNLPCRVTYSIKYFELEKGYEKDSIYPDIPIVATLEDLTVGRDAEVETILELVKK